ncbi:GPP34 family phosphoprotein [Streptomyces sp. NPDC049970]|uniref:GOLPH3/VPS74 family protein n=1 Tax=Streptomyces sp. NPDC049970 TaxID=3155033 RepID=UPI00342AC800
MNTAKDLFIIAMDVGQKHSVGQGDLSLALAGAELVDLIEAEAVTLDADRVVPAPRRTLEDRLLGEAASALSEEVPFEQVDDWLWRRGRDLSAAYQTAFEDAGELLRRGTRGRLNLGADRLELADTPSRHRALRRWEDEEPVLASLAEAVGIPNGASEPGGTLGGEALTTVVAAVNDAVMELEAVRQRRSIENAAFANVWRGP